MPVIIVMIIIIRCIAIILIIIDKQISYFITTIIIITIMIAGRTLPQTLQLGTARPSDRANIAQTNAYNVGAGGFIVWLAGWRFGLLVLLLLVKSARFGSLSVGRLADWLDGWAVSAAVRWLVVWLAVCVLAGWFVGWLVGWAASWV